MNDVFKMIYVWYLSTDRKTKYKPFAALAMKFDTMSWKIIDYVTKEFDEKYNTRNFRSKP